jgi:hypothetical protein
VTALEIYREQRRQQIEDGPFSESFYLDPYATRVEIRGIYDEPYLAGESDQGNVRKQLQKPRVVVDEIPASVIARSTQIEVRGKVYRIEKPDRDPDGIPRMWLL